MSKTNKANLVNALKADFEERLNDLLVQINDLEDSKNSESKSTAGDKHEVGRAMAQNELDNLKKRFAELKGNLATLNQLDLSKSEEVRSGSLVKTESAIFMLGLGVGRFTFEEETIFVISSVSPIGKVLLGKKTGDAFSFNGKTHSIVELS